MKNKIEAMVVGGSIGDAMGLPLEMKTQEFINTTFGKVNSFLPASLHNKLKNEVSPDITGITSDDTAMTLAIIKSIIRKKTIDCSDVMDTSVSTYRDAPLGYGSNTRKIFDNYQIGEYKKLKKGMSAGNGIIMKLSPLSAFFVTQKTPENEIEKVIIEITSTSHGDPIALVSSLVHNKFLMNLLDETSNKNVEGVFKELIIYAEKKENELYTPGENSDSISELLQNIYSDYRNNRLINTQYILQKYGWGDNMKKSAYVVTTLGICYSLFLRGEKDFETLLDGINFGGDTDTYGAILGNMVGAYRGIFYSKNTEKGVQNIQNIKKITNTFIETILH